jgi:hypothetical protein
MMAAAGYFASPWPGEDAGPQRLQMPHGTPALALQPGETLGCTTRNTLLSTMTVLGAPGEVFLLTHSALRAKLGLPTSARVEKIHPTTLKTLRRSPRLRGGPMWPGGMAVHRNGDLYVVYGRWAHRLNRHCEPQAAGRLPVNQPYNSFVILDNGLLVTKNLSRQTPAQLSVLDPERLQQVGEDAICPEPSVARLSAHGNSVYVVGTRSIFRYHWDAAAQRLRMDPDWRFDYLGSSQQSHGWDAVLDGHHAWFMDNGHHNYQVSMLSAGQVPTPNRLLRVALNDAQDHAALAVHGALGGSVTNPPLVDTARRIVLAYDSANRYLGAWRWAEPGPHSGLTPLWHKQPFGCASHMLLYPQSGEVVVNDYSRRHGEQVVVLRITDGAELGRAQVGGLMQGVVFPSVGWQRDVYWSSMGRLARVFVQPAVSSQAPSASNPPS